jgi:hypothetical protein
MSGSLELIEGDPCSSYLEYLYCGELCSPDQASFINNAAKSYQVCQSFCDDLYASCAETLHYPTNKLVGEAFSTSSSFCLSKNFTIDGYKLELASGNLNCFSGIDTPANASDSYLYGRGLYDGFAGELYSFTLQAVDTESNPKGFGGDNVEIFENPNISDAVFLDNEDGTYTALFVPSVGTYVFDVRIDGNSVQDSPFNVEFQDSPTCPLKDGELPTKVCF